MADLYRLRNGDDDLPSAHFSQPPISVGEWLDFLETRRNALIMELRGIDRHLVHHGRIRAETLPRRARSMPSGHSSTPALITPFDRTMG